MTAAYLVRGDARRLPLVDKSVQCIVTSPPYFGLRSYGGQTSVWGGDPECPHTLADDPAVKPMTGGTGTASGKQTSNKGSQFGNAWAEVGGQRSLAPQRDSPGGFHNSTSRGQQQNTAGKAFVGVSTGATCTRCGAWRGELGSEPTPALFVAHLVEVMRECWRVLRDDGVAFVNMGDSYAGSGKGPTGHNGIGDQIKRQGFRPGNPDKNHGNSNRDGLGTVPGTRPKSLVLVPERLAIALSDDGWIVRQILIWAKNNPMPESVRDRWTTAHEYVLMLVKQPRYFFDQAGIQEPNTEGSLARHGNGPEKPFNSSRMVNEDAVPPGADRLHWGTLNVNGLHTNGRNGRSVWNVNSEPSKIQHFAQFPREIPRRCILAASREGDIVLDPFSGSGTTAYVAASMGRIGVGVELSAEYVAQARYGRLAQDFLPLAPEAPQVPAVPARAVEWPRDLFEGIEA